MRWCPRVVQRAACSKLRAGGLLLEGSVFTQHPPQGSCSSLLVTWLMQEASCLGIVAGLGHRLAPLCFLPEFPGHCCPLSVAWVKWPHVHFPLEAYELFKTGPIGSFESHSMGAARK